MLISPSRRINRGRFVAVVAALTVASSGLVACSPSNQQDSTSGKVDNAATSAAAKTSVKASAEQDSAAPVHMHDGVVRAMAQDADMTAIFGTLHNESDSDIEIVSFSTNVEASMQQIHEVVDGVMQEKEGGLKIPAGQTLTLAPGGDHFMLMGVKTPIMAGESVELTVKLADGSTVDLGEVPVRSMDAGAEGYEDMGDMHHDHGADASANPSAHQHAH